MTPTPETDAELLKAAKGMIEHDGVAIMTDFARKLERELAVALASLPMSTNRTRDEARQMCGEVLRHDDGDGASHGCVEVQQTQSVIDILIGYANQLRKELKEANTKLQTVSKAIEKAQALNDAKSDNEVAAEASFSEAMAYINAELLEKERDQWHEMARELAAELDWRFGQDPWRNPKSGAGMVLARFNEMEMKP
jgi:hypothetical protein